MCLYVHLVSDFFCNIYKKIPPGCYSCFWKIMYVQRQNWSQIPQLCYFLNLFSCILKMKVTMYLKTLVKRRINYFPTCPWYQSNHFNEAKTAIAVSRENCYNTKQTRNFSIKLSLLPVTSKIMGEFHVCF